MGRVFLVELEGRAYECKFCRSHLAHADDIESRSFNCRHGKAYLFTNAFHSKLIGTMPPLSYLESVNIILGPKEERSMISGMHTVADIFCCCCGQIVGWKYEAAHDKTQKYKEGKFVLERGRIVDVGDGEFNLEHNYGVSDTEEA